MSNIKSWSTTPASNNSAPPSGAPEGMAPSTVNDIIRQQMADHRTQWEDAEWFDLGHTPTRTGNTTFTVTGNQLAYYTSGRKLRCSDGSILYGSVLSSSFTAVTTVTTALDGNLTTSLSSVAVGIMTGKTSSFADSIFRIEGSSDSTKKLAIEVDGFTTAQTRTATPPNYDFRIMSQTHGADIVAAGTTDLDAATGDLVDVTGNTGITAITLSEGRCATVRFTGTPVITHGASLILPGASDITAAAGDIAEFRGYAAGVVRLTKYLRLNARMMVDAITSTSAVATTSGNTVALTTTVPTWAKRVTLLFDSVSSNGTADYLVQLGDSGGLESSGYVAESAVTTSAATVISTSTAGFIVRSVSAGNAHNGKMELMLSGTANTWVSTHVMRQATNSMCYGGGIKATSATMDRISITTVGGTDAFDAGSITILYE